MDLWGGLRPVQPLHVQHQGGAEGQHQVRCGDGETLVEVLEEG